MFPALNERPQFRDPSGEGSIGDIYGFRDEEWRFANMTVIGPTEVGLQALSSPSTLVSMPSTRMNSASTTTFHGGRRPPAFRTH